ncbi:MAG: acetyl-CoA carboxylase carboxyl transferase subunit beta, partial [Candidatus Geothermincolia bacterium]
MTGSREMSLTAKTEAPAGNTVAGTAASLDIATGLWTRCGGCDRLIYKSVLAANLRVCPHCEAHLPLGAKERLALVLDEGSFEPDRTRLVPRDPLSFTDTRQYAERLEDNRKKSGLD